MRVTTYALGLTLLLFAVGVVAGAEGYVYGVVYAAIVGAIACSVVFFLTLKRFLLGLAFLCLVVALGALRVTFIPQIHDDALNRVLEQKHIFLGEVLHEPDQRESSTHLTILLLELDGVPMVVPARALVTVPRYPEYQFGDTLRLSGKLQLPEDFIVDPLRPAFPYVQYLAKDGIGYVMRYPTVEVFEHYAGGDIHPSLIAFKRAILDRIGILFSEPSAGLLSGILLGAKRALGSDMLEVFRFAGLVHIVVLSGYNMTIVAEFFARILGSLPLRYRTLIGMLFVVLFAVMVGGGATVVRATIMTLLALFARMTGRIADAGRLLFIAGFAMVAHNPLIVRDDPSFQLSFIATLGLIYGAPIVERWFGWIRQTQMRAIIASTAAVQIAVLPLLLSLSGNLSPYALIANLVVLPLIPVTMMLGAVAVGISYVFMPLSIFVSWVATGLLSWIVFVAETVVQLPFATLQIGAVPMWVMLCSEGPIVAIALFVRRRDFNLLHVSQEKRHHNERNDHDRKAIPPKDFK